ncbi:MAG: hypothetical protein AVDCRST_MAG88-577, partial [uncultured Thermomicrobiales bacterium]
MVAAATAEPEPVERSLREFAAALVAFGRGL